ncbi:centromere protein O [Hyperolius riggenbachi]|uniref:centromere protein O n=1 Tax=Hyperolius riggenbachi TaxID=752182 RepID=UPI0035A30ABC
MEKAEALFREGVISHLQELENISRSLAIKQEQKKQQGRELLEKREEVVRLQRERDELCSKIQQQKEEIQGFQKRKENKCPAPSTHSSLQELRLEEMESIMEALWFTGISGKLTDEGACFCISTAFEGTYLDSYNLQVSSLRNPQITRHAIPPFIQLKDLAKEHLPASLRKLLSVLSQQLNGYAGRKFQADQLEKSSAYVPTSLEKNSLHTVLSFQYNAVIEGQTSCFSARLLYRDVTRTLPTEAQVTCADEEALLQEVTSSHESLFYSKALHRVLESLSS